MKVLTGAVLDALGEATTLVGARVVAGADLAAELQDAALAEADDAIEEPQVIMELGAG